MSSHWVEGHCHHVMVVVWSCWMEGLSPLSSWRWCARADVVVVVSPCHGCLVVIARLGGGVVTSVVLALVSLSLSRPWHLLWVSHCYRKAGWRGGRLHCPGAGMHTLALLSSSCHGRLDVFVLAWTCCRLAMIVFIVLAWTHCHRCHCCHRRVMVAFAMHASLSSSLSWWWLRHRRWFLLLLLLFSCACAAVVVVVDLVWMRCCRRRHRCHPEGHDGRDAGRRAGRCGRRCIVVVVVVVAALSMLDIAVIHVAVGVS